MARKYISSHPFHHCTMTANEVNIHQGYNQLAPNATQVIQQIFLDDRYAAQCLLPPEHRRP